MCLLIKELNCIFWSSLKNLKVGWEIFNYMSWTECSSFPVFISRKSEESCFLSFSLNYLKIKKPLLSFRRKTQNHKCMIILILWNKAMAWFYLSYIFWFYLNVVKLKNSLIFALPLYSHLFINGINFDLLKFLFFSLGGNFRDFW